jgi:hypothetical protein
VSVSGAAVIPGDAVTIASDVIPIRAVWAVTTVVFPAGHLLYDDSRSVAAFLNGDDLLGVTAEAIGVGLGVLFRVG